MDFQATKDFAERACLLADVRHFEKQRRKHDTGASHRDGQAVSAGDGVADSHEVGMDPATGDLGLALPGAADIDAGIGLDGQAVTQLRQGFVRELWLKEHGGGPLSVVRDPSLNVSRRFATDNEWRATPSLWRICIYSHSLRPNSTPRPAGRFLRLG